MEINKYKCIIGQTLQSQIQESVENEETYEETQGQANNESRKASVQGFAEQKTIDECIANIRCEGNCINTASSQTQPQNPREPKVIW